jgi:hypothetical protein
MGGIFDDFTALRMVGHFTVRAMILLMSKTFVYSASLSVLRYPGTLLFAVRDSYGEKSAWRIDGTVQSIV